MMLSNSSGRCFCFFLPDCSQNHHYAADLIRTLSARLFRGCGVIMVYIIMIMLRHGSYPWCAIWGLCWCYFFDPLAMFPGHKGMHGDDGQWGRGLRTAQILWKPNVEGTQPPNYQQHQGKVLTIEEGFDTTKTSQYFIPPFF